MDNDVPSHSMVCSGREYFIYEGDDQDESWGNATFVLFHIVNRQLERTDYRFFAISDGNDLGGMFLTAGQPAWRSEMQLFFRSEPALIGRIEAAGDR